MNSTDPRRPAHELLQRLRARVSADVLVAGFFSLIFIWAGWTTLGFPTSARLAPLFVVAPGAILSIWALILTLRQRRGREEVLPHDGDAERDDSPARGVIQGGAWALAFPLAAFALGFHLGLATTGIAYVLIKTRRLPEADRPTVKRRLILAAAVGASLVAIILLFEDVLHVYFPSGRL